MRRVQEAYDQKSRTCNCEAGLHVASGHTRNLRQRYLPIASLEGAEFIIPFWEKGPRDWRVSKIQQPRIHSPSPFPCRTDYATAQKAATKRMITRSGKQKQKFHALTPTIVYNA